MIVTLVVRSQTITLTIGALNTSGGGGGGVSIHNYLTGRSTTDAHPIAAITGLQAALDAKAASDHTHADATGSAAGFMTAAHKTKLDGIASGATANASDADLRARSSHTGTQLAATISDFTSAAAAAAPVQSVAGRTGAVVIVVGDVSGAEASANKAQANGYASLDSGGKVPQAQIPAIAITEYLGDVASQAAMLALSGQKGDWCTRSDTGATWIITGTDPTLLGSWTSVTYPASPVTSVAGRTGAVTISSTDITDSTSAGRAVMTAANAAAIRTAAGVVIGTDVQAYSATLAGTTAAFTTAQETKLAGIEAAADVTDAGNVGAAIDGATAKTTPVDADTVALIDSAASNALKKLSWANIKATAKTYFDTLYQAASATLTTWAGITPGTGIATALGTNVGTAGSVVVNGGALGTPTSGVLTNCTFPTLNQNTSGYAEALKSATTTVSVSAATAPSSGQVLTATSGTAATWQTPSAGAGTKTFLVRSPLQNEPPASSFATLDTRNSIPCLDFDAAADESAIFSGVAPEGIVLTSGIIARIVWAATSATSGNVRWRVAFERRTTDQDSDSWDTATEATDATNGTSGICEVCEITCTTIDSIVAGDSFRVCVTRVGTDGTNDTMTGDAELFGFELRAA